MARAETGQSESLFDEAEQAAASAAAPLAVRMRPRTLDEVIGQQHLTSAGTPFRKLVDNDAPMSLLLWGPPGTGKTTLAYVVSQVTKRRFVELSAVSAGGRDSLDEEAADHLVRLAGGDARRTLTYLEAAALGLPRGGHIDTAVLERAVDRAAVRYDRDGDQHYDVISAFIKSMRGSDVDAALHYLARMIEAGEDPRFIARRLVIHASEDVGMADPSALQTAVAALEAS